MIFYSRRFNADFYKKHGVPRTSGLKPVSEQPRKKEIRKIEEYRNLVDHVNRYVNLFYLANPGILSHQLGQKRRILQ